MHNVSSHLIPFLDLRVGQMLQQLMVEVDMSDFINISCVHVVSMTTTSFGCVQVSMGVILHAYD